LGGDFIDGVHGGMASVHAVAVATVMGDASDTEKLFDIAGTHWMSPTYRAHRSITCSRYFGIGYRQLEPVVISFSG